MRTLWTLAPLTLALLVAACTPEPIPNRSIAEREAAEARRQQAMSESAQAAPRPDEVAVAGSLLQQSPAPSTLAFALAPGALMNIRPPAEPPNRENYAHQDENPVRRAAEQPVSTFSIDVDTGAYANVRRFLNQGRLPPQDAVRVEELINYFQYDYPRPDGLEPPFSVTTELAPTPWNAKTLLLHVGLQGYTPDPADVPAANLVFLVDVSGSMESPDKLELLKSALKLLTRQLDRDDWVAIAVYAGAAGVVLPPTAGNRAGEIASALDSLTAGGSTNGGAGIQLAYSLARQSFVDGGVNRVILATDGDFNVGTVDFEALKDLVERQRNSGIALTTLGFGTGNYNDHLMEQLADAGNGNYAYIDTLNEARKVLVDQLQATLLTIAKDVKVQIEFNPALVEEYRLIGYENRTLAREDFNNDAVDAGEIGAGHSVTALYEIALKGSGGALSDPLRYAAPEPAAATGDEIAFLRLRYKSPAGGTSRLLERPLTLAQVGRDWQQASETFRFAAAVAAFGQRLRGGRYGNGFGWEGIHDLAAGSRGGDRSGYRSEFLSLVDLAAALDTPPGEQPQALR